MSEKLKPCPFCGGEHLTIFVGETPIPNGKPKYGFTFIKQVYIQCKKKCVTGNTFVGSKAMNNAIKAWNRRPK